MKKGKTDIDSEKDIKFSVPQYEICTKVAQLNLFMAGAGSGKTHAMGIISGDFIVNSPETVGFIGANTYGQLNKATLKRIFEVWKDLFGWTNGAHYIVDKKPPKSWMKFAVELKEYKNVLSFNNGCQIMLGSLDNYKAIDGVEFGWALLDETKDTKQEAVQEVITGRLRQVSMYKDLGVAERAYYNLKEAMASGKEIEGYQPLFIFTSPARVQWLNEWFELDDHYEEITLRCKSKTDFYQRHHGVKHVVISSTYHNEHNLPPNYINQKLESWAGDEAKIDRLIYGSPVSKTGGEWFTRFDRQIHVKECGYDPDLPLHITLDFNVSPYMTLLVSQLEEVDGRWEDRTFKEYTLENPKNNTEDICNEFFYDFASHKAGLYYYGDHSGKNKQTVTKDITHNYDQLERVLYSMLHNTSDRVLSNNPSLAPQKTFVNRLMNGSLGVDIIISPSCRKLINDMEYLKEGPNGGYVKVKATDPDTKITYEKLGHCADAWRYKVTGLFHWLYDAIT